MASQPGFGTILGARAYWRAFCGRPSFWRWGTELVGSFRADQRRRLVLPDSILADRALSHVVGHCARFALGSGDTPANHPRGASAPQSAFALPEANERYLNLSLWFPTGWRCLSGGRRSM